MTEPCMFPNLHEPFYCRIHADVRLRLTDERCRAGVTLTQPQPDAGLREALEIIAANPTDAPDAIGVTARNIARAAIAAAPAAPQPDAGSRTECSLAGVHAHSFQGPHVFHEWEPGTQPDEEATR